MVSLSIGVQMVQLSSLLRVSQAAIKVSAGLGFYLEALGKNPLPSSFRLLADFSSLWL